MKLLSQLTLIAALAAAISSPLFAQETAPAETAAPEKKVESTDPTIAASRPDLKWKTGGSWMEVHERYVKRAQQGNVNLVFFGDSITQWWPGADFKNRYGALGAVDFGIGGDKTQNVLWRIQNGEMDGITPRVAVVLIGTNNLGSASSEKIAQGITIVVQAIRAKSPTTKVLLLGIFRRGWDGKQMAGKIKEVNATIAKLDDGKMVRFLDLKDQMLEPDGSFSRDISKDSLHLKPAGYNRWATGVQPLLYEMLGLPIPPAATPATAYPVPPTP